MSTRYEVGYQGKTFQVLIDGEEFEVSGDLSRKEFIALIEHEYGPYGHYIGSRPSPVDVAYAIETNPIFSSFMRRGKRVKAPILKKGSVR